MDRLGSPWATLLFAGIALGLLLLLFLGASIVLWSRGAILGSAIGIALVGAVTAVAAHLGSKPGTPRG